MTEKDQSVLCGIDLKSAALIQNFITKIYFIIVMQSQVYFYSCDFRMNLNQI